MKACVSAKNSINMQRTSDKAWWETIDYGLSEKEQKAVHILAQEIARRVQFYNEVRYILFISSFYA